MSLNTAHKVTLTEGQILYNSLHIGGLYVKGDTSNDPDLPKEVDAIFEELEGVVDKYYDKIEKQRVNNPHQIGSLKYKQIISLRLK